MAFSSASPCCAPGSAVEVVEKNPKWDVYGVGMIQPPNAWRALHDIGLAEQSPRSSDVRRQDAGRRRRDLPRRARLGAARRGLLLEQRHRLPGPPPHPAGRRCPARARRSARGRTRSIDDGYGEVTVGFTDGDTRLLLVIGGLRPALAGRDGRLHVQPDHGSGARALQFPAHRGARPSGSTSAPPARPGFAGLDDEHADDQLAGDWLPGLRLSWRRRCASGWRSSAGRSPSTRT